MVVVWLVCVGCSSPISLRIAPLTPPPASCDATLCGGSVQVTTTLAPNTVLTAAECKSVCASMWCGTGIPPIGGLPGCTLGNPSTVNCGAIAYDCGETFGTHCGSDNCAGCCRADGSCAQEWGACGGASCLTCARDQRCSATACAALSACGGQLEAAPRVSTCADADGGINPSLDLTQACLDACNASDAGAVLECARARVGTCDDAGVVFATQCVPDAGAPSACVSACVAERNRCDQACPRNSFTQCMGCSTSCGLTFAQCATACGP